jgi:predicted nucleic acid-binding protein
MKNYVVDASIIIKWVLGDEKEPDHEKAMGLLNAWGEGDAYISAPKLWQYEVGNFLGRRIREEASEKMDILLNLNIKGVELTEKMFRQCFSWMRDNAVTFYDASYLATAFDVNGMLVTADEKFVNKMKKTKRICLLKDLIIP